MRGPMYRGFAPSTLAVFAGAAVSLAACSGTEHLITADPPPAHSELVFSEDFDGLGLNASRWDTSWWVGPIFHTDLAWFSEDAISVRDGTLRITADREAAARDSDPDDVRPYSSGQVSTRQTFDHGTFEIRARHDQGANLVQAIWLLPHPYQFPPEIDIAETRLSVDPRTVYFNVHTGTEDAFESQPSYTIKGRDLDDAWHVYRLVWDTDGLAWYMDNELVRSQPNPVAAVPMRLLIDQTWILPWSGGGPIDEELPVTFEVDYVRIWQ